MGVDCAGNLVRTLSNPVEHLLHLRGVEIPDLETHDHPARNDVRRARLGAHAADGCHVPALHGLRHLDDSEDEVRGAHQRVAPLVHRRRPGVVRKAGHRHVPPAYADDAFDDADVRPACIQDAALLDVQFDVGQQLVRPALRLAEAIGVTAHRA